MGDELDTRLAELAARFDEQLARLDAAIAVRSPSAAGQRAPAPASSGASLLARIRRLPEASPWDAVTQRLTEVEKLLKALRRSTKQEYANADEWERRAMLCVKAKDEDLAREALNRRREHVAKAADLEIRATQVEDTLQQLQRAVDELRRTST